MTALTVSTKTDVTVGMRRRGAAASIIVAVAACPVLSTYAEAAPQYPLVRSYQLEVTLSPEQGTMRGRATMQFADLMEDLSGKDGEGKAPDGIVFYLHDGLDVDAIEIGGSTAPFESSKVDYAYSYTTKATRVTIQSTDRHRLNRGMTVSYSGTFKASTARTPSDYMRIDSDGVLLRSYGYSLWYPVFLEAGRDTYETTFSNVTIDVPNPFVPVFVGERIRDRQGDGRLVSEWRAEEFDLQAAQLTARRFTVTSHGGVHVYHDGRDASRAGAEKILGYVERLHTLFSANYNPNRAFEQVHVMQMPRYGDISSGNVIGMSDRAWFDYDNAEWPRRVLAHEFVHPFVQPRVKRSDPLFALAIEGFPSYFHLPVMAELDGEALYTSYISGAEKRYLEKRRSGVSGRGETLPKEKPLYAIGPDEIGDYKDLFVLSDRALLFFDYLRRTSGKEAFFGFTRRLFDRSDLDSASFERLIQRHFPVSKEDLDLWLRTSEFPDRFRRPGGSQPGKDGRSEDP